MNEWNGIPIADNVKELNLEKENGYGMSPYPCYILHAITINPITGNEQKRSHRFTDIKDMRAIIESEYSKKTLPTTSDIDDNQIKLKKKQAIMLNHLLHSPFYDLSLSGDVIKEIEEIEWKGYYYPRQRGLLNLLRDRYRQLKRGTYGY